MSETKTLLSLENILVIDVDVPKSNFLKAPPPLNPRNQPSRGIGPMNQSRRAVHHQQDGQRLESAKQTPGTDSRKSVPDRSGNITINCLEAPARRAMFPLTAPKKVLTRLVYSC